MTLSITLTILWYFVDYRDFIAMLNVVVLSVAQHIFVKVKSVGSTNLNLGILYMHKYNCLNMPYDVEPTLGVKNYNVLPFGRFQTLTANGRPDLDYLPGTNAPAYFSETYFFQLLLWIFSSII
jgi:hypothetical protein